MAINFSQLPYIFRENGNDRDTVRFVGSCLYNIPNTNSQNFQDIWALYENRFKTNGFFVEFGATDGVTGSNTFLLESQYGWRGIVAEPNPVHFHTLRKNRPNSKVESKAVYMDSGNNVQFMIASESDLSTIDGYGHFDEHAEKRELSIPVAVETISLFDLLETHNAPETIDYLSIDTEGSELDILSAFFLLEEPKYNFRCITVEHNFNEKSRTAIFDLLSANGYERKFTDISRWDDFYGLRIDR